MKPWATETVSVGLLPGPTGEKGHRHNTYNVYYKNLNNIDNRKESEFKNSWRRFRICVFFMQFQGTRTGHFMSYFAPVARHNTS